MFIVVTKLLVRPYKNATKNIQDVMSELVLIVILLIFTKYVSEDTKFATSGSAFTYGQICIALIFWIMICNYI